MNEPLRRGLRTLLGPARPLLDAHAQLLFARSPVTGLLLVAAVALEPRALASGALAVLTATRVVDALGFAASGAYACNALLLGIGLAHHFENGVRFAALVVAASVVVVLFTAALSSSLGRIAGLPVLSLPFVAVFGCAETVARPLGLTPAAPLAEVTHRLLGLLPLQALGSLLFSPRAVTGLLVFAALVAHSRISAALALFVLTPFVWVAMSQGADPAPLQAAALNGALAAIAVGTVWFVPSRSSFALGACAAAMAAGLALVLFRAPSALAANLFILPFNVSVLVVLFAMRQRALDRTPKAVDFVPGTPEENLAYYQTRLARFDSLYDVPFSLPFTGTWTCTQGVDGAHTHRGLWRHGFDFEVFESASPFRAAGERLDDHLCYQLPVVAAASGTVVAIVDDVPDNAVGAVDLERNWGNVVVLQHAVGLFSLVAHLTPGSIAVAPGTLVRRGQILGRCGSSGRSPRPHLHFQLQGAPALGSATLPCRFRDVVVYDPRGDERLARAEVPREGGVLRNIEPDEAVAARCRFVPGTHYAFRADDRVERFSCEVDLVGATTLRSLDDGARLTLGYDERGLTLYDVIAPARSTLYALRAALSRVPFDRCPSITWTDYLPVRGASWLPRAFLRELGAVFAPNAAIAMEYRQRIDGNEMIVTGVSAERTRSGTPVVRTVAKLIAGMGPVAFEVHTPNRAVRVERVPDSDAGTPPRDSPASLPARSTQRGLDPTMGGLS
jgi:murein DD-endopeptidase MepM/ murein hydrolase activator NlpD